MIVRSGRPSVKEAVDKLPAGILFYRKNGLVMLCNHTMNGIAHRLQGEPMQDGASFWREVCERSEELPDGTRLLHLEGADWLMNSEEGEFEGAPIMQVFAQDVTELAALTRRLEEEKARIASVAARLRRYNDDVLELTARRELLGRKAHIHDELGRLLAETRHLLSGGDADEEALWERWTFNAELMLSEARRPDEDLAASLQKAASDVGVSLRMSGEVPTDDLAADLVFAIVGESLANLLRHAGGDELAVSITDAGHDIRVEVTNNGAPPNGPIKEGGGLGALRRKAESIDGSMEVSWEPAFKLVFDIPRREDA